MRRPAPALALALAGALATVSSFACKRSTEESRRVGTIARAPRVVSLSPSTTEALFAIGAGAETVGRSRYCDRPAEARNLPQVGGYVDPNLEAILALHPTLAVGARGPAGAGITERLTAQGIDTYFPEADSLAGIDAMLNGLGARVGHAFEAAKVVSALDQDLEQITRSVAGATRPRVLLVFGLEPVVVAGPGGFTDELIGRAGATNVVTSGPRYPTLGMERILALDPDVILDAAVAENHGAERIAGDAAGWRELRAVKSGHVVNLSDEEVLRPGPNIAEGLRTLVQALHPEVADGSAAPAARPLVR